MPNTRIGPVIMSPGKDKAETSNNSQNFSPVKGKKSKNRKENKSLITQLVDESDEVTQSCHRCKKGFEDGALSIQCDRCSEWFHLGCTKLSKAQFNFLGKCNNNELLWFCDPCKIDDKDQFHPGAAIAQQAIKLEALTQIVITLQQQNSVIINKLTKEKSEDDQIQVHVKEYLNEQNELNDIKNNLILFNLPEAENNDGEIPEETDLKITKEIFECVDNTVDTSKFDTSKVFRMGKRRQGNNIGPRPIKIILNSSSEKSKILSKTKKLRDSSSFGQVRISVDRTKKEREQYRQLKNRCDELRKESGEDYVIFRGECVVRDKIPNIIKNSKRVNRNTTDSGSTDNGNIKN